MGTHQPIATPEKNGAVWLAGEASGDFIASLVLPEVERRMNGAPQYGVGGPRMREAGFHAWHDIRELSVRGYVEVLSHLPRLLRLRSHVTVRFGEPIPASALFAAQGERSGLRCAAARLSREINGMLEEKH